MYWQLELLNAVLLPIGAVLLSFSYGPLGIASLIAIGAMVGLLIAGGVYWRAKLHALSRKQPPDRTIAALARAQAPLLLLTLATVAAAVASLALPSARASSYDAIIASTAATLAVLEYVNYYHVQLQHFDHWADFQRLLTGRGFRRSKLREDIEHLRR